MKIYCHIPVSFLSNVDTDYMLALPEGLELRH